MPNDSLQNVGEVGKVGKMMPNDSLQNVVKHGKVVKHDAQRFFAKFWKTWKCWKILDKKQSEARLEPDYRTKTLSILNK